MRRGGSAELPDKTGADGITVIEPSRTLFGFNRKELWEFRDLIWLFAKRDLLIVYKQTVLGPLWFIIQPVLMTLLFTVVFGRIANINTGGIPHIIFFMSGMVLWNYLSAVTSHTAQTLRANFGILSKVWFPRLVLPIAAVITNLAHLALGFCVFLVFYIVELSKGADMAPTLWLLALPLLVVHVSCLGLAVGMWIAAVSVKYRDLALALPIFMQIWMFASPIIYPAAGVVDPALRMLLLLNPLAPALELFRHALTGSGSVEALPIAAACAITALLFFGGLAVFEKTQRNFVDVV